MSCDLTSELFYKRGLHGEVIKNISDLPPVDSSAAILKCVKVKRLNLVVKQDKCSSDTVYDKKRQRKTLFSFAKWCLVWVTDQIIFATQTVRAFSFHLD